MLALPERFQPVRELGSGGMGTVYQAFDRLLDRQVAVKMLHPQTAEDAAHLKQLLAEARIVSELRHENIVKMLAISTAEDTTPFLVMELLEGNSLSELLKGSDQPLPVVQTLQILVQVVRGLEFSHGRSVVHRDIKPSNIFVVQKDGQPLVKLVDFGIARHGVLQSSTMTQLVGSPPYLSPEQCLGQRGGMLSDLYAVGCVLHECLAGTPPLLGETALETMQMQMQEQPVPLRKLRNDVPVSLQNVVLKLLSKQPENRHQSASELLADLVAIQLHITDGAPEPHIAIEKEQPRRATRGRSRRRMAVVASLSVAALCLIAIVYSLQGSRTPPEGEVSKETDTAIHGTLIQPMRVRTHQQDEDYTSLYDFRADKNVIAAALEKELAELPDRPDRHELAATIGRTHQYAGVAYLDAGDPAAAYQHAVNAARIFKDPTLKEPVKRATAVALMARAYAAAGKKEQALKLLKRAEALVPSSALVARRHGYNDYRLVRNAQVEVLSRCGQHQLACKIAKEEFMLHGGGKDDQRFSAWLTALGRAGDYQELLQVARERPNWDKQTLSKFIGLMEIGKAYLAVGDDANALKTFETAIQEAPKSTIEHSWPLQECRIGKAQVLHKRSQFKEEVAELESALRVQQNYWVAKDYRLPILDALKAALHAQHVPAQLIDLYSKDYQLAKQDSEARANQDGLPEQPAY